MWKFRSILIRSFLKQFLNFLVRPKYCISRHFNFVVWSKYYNLRHFNFSAVLKIAFFMCVGIQHFTNFEKSRCLNARLNTFLSFFTNYWFKKSIKNTRKICGKQNIKKAFSQYCFSTDEFLKVFFAPFYIAFWSRNFALLHFNFTAELKKDFWRHFNFTDFGSQPQNREVFMPLKFLALKYILGESYIWICRYFDKWRWEFCECVGLKWLKTNWRSLQW